MCLCSQHAAWVCVGGARGDLQIYAGHEVILLSANLVNDFGYSLALAKLNNINTRKCIGKI